MINGSKNQQFPRLSFYPLPLILTLIQASITQSTVKNVNIGSNSSVSMYWRSVTDWSRWSRLILVGLMAKLLRKKR